MWRKDVIDNFSLLGKPFPVCSQPVFPVSGPHSCPKLHLLLHLAQDIMVPLSPVLNLNNSLLGPRLQPGSLHVFKCRIPPPCFWDFWPTALHLSFRPRILKFEVVLEIKCKLQLPRETRGAQRRQRDRGANTSWGQPWHMGVLFSQAFHYLVVSSLLC